jgi:hypothetical protein
LLGLDGGTDVIDNEVVFFEFVGDVVVLLVVKACSVSKNELLVEFDLLVHLLEFLTLAIVKLSKILEYLSPLI